MAPTLLIGLTGPVGAGKSTVLAWCAAAGAATLDLDDVVHRLLRGDDALQARVLRRFGPDLAGPEGIDRGRLARVVFADPQALGDLEAIIHPAVNRHVDAWYADLDRRGAGARAGVAVVEGIKIVEAGMGARCDALWIVTCDRRERERRMAARGWDSGEIARRTGATAPLETWYALADEIVDNTGPWEATVVQLHALWTALGLAPGNVKEEGA